MKEVKKRKKRKENPIPASWDHTFKLIRAAQAAEKNKKDNLPTPEDLERERNIDRLINKKFDEMELEYAARADKYLEAEEFQKDYPDVKYLTKADQKVRDALGDIVQKEDLED